MPTLYVTEPGARIEKEYKRILVMSKDEEALFNAPLAHVTELVIVGSVGITTQAMLSLLEAGVSFSIVSRAGKLLGRLMPPTEGNIFLRREQYKRAADPAFCFPIAKAIVLGKLKNQRAFAKRILRTNPEISKKAMEQLDGAIADAENETDLERLRGREGIGAKAYFEILRAALPKEWEFKKRSRRPPKDPANALLSLGYSLLTQNMMTALEVAGLDPYDGFFHADVYGRPALALDLVEEFRSLIVDSVTLTLVNKRILTSEDFVSSPEGGYTLKQPALKKFLAQYNARLQTEVLHPLAGRAVTYQKCFEVQARQLRRVIQGKAEKYQPFLTK
ncbi:MAG: CRISPR-associated endonuclease Cas1 [Chloroflexi bacterium CFX1]|nr:CRISPR-associated endonuclease Cas1 [Chloroflexi bacterium CFX1]MCQ3952982.1 CRISPR-associated endonuclease Cas1 [Chloroflexota bacterium]MDL1919495.1 CRISPR-associated endonuclease Cas1 [Chloroflexi bacterium CFX5]